MTDDRLLFELSDGIVILTLNRPGVMNAFEDGMREALFQRLEACADDPAVRCVVITGAGRAFSAGGDIASMAQLQAQNDLSVVEARMAIAGQVIQQIRRMPQPVLAAVNGAAAGGGMNLALACDMRIASDKAVFAESFVKIGLVPDWCGFDFLTKLIGTAKAMELMMLGDRIDAAEALRLGLVNLLLTSKGVKFSPIAFLYYVAPLCAAALLLPWLVTELPRLSHHNFRAVHRAGALTLLANASVAFLLNLATMALIKHTSALTLNVSGVFKDLLLIVYSVIVSGAVVTDASLSASRSTAARSASC